MKWFADWLLPVLIVAAGLGGAYLLSGARAEVETAVREDPVPVVALVTAVPAVGRWTVHSQGTVAPRREVRLLAEVPGRVVERTQDLRAGGFVEAGQVLLEIDGRDYQLAVDRAQAEIAQAEVGLKVEQAEAEVARDEWAAMGEGAANALVLREPQIAGAEARLAAARAVLTQTELDLERTRVTAPFASRVLSEQVEVGQFLARGSPLCVLFATDFAEVRLPIPDAELAALELDLTTAGGPGPDVVLSADFAGAARTWHGRVVRTEARIDARTRMLHLVVEVRDPYDSGAHDGVPLTVGMFVRAEIQGRALVDVIEIPRVALWSASEVLVVNAQQRLSRRAVEVLRTEGERVFIGAGLVAGEQLCISPLATLTDGMLVRATATEPPR